MRAFSLGLAAGLILVATGLSMTFFGCGQTAGGTSSPVISPALIKDVSPVQANSLIQMNKDNTKFVVLDVRTPQEYSEGHLSNTINIDYNASNFKSEVGRLDKGKKYLVYCRTGIRSAAASKIMVELGFKDINNMTGGITDWQAQGFPVVK